VYSTLWFEGYIQTEG